MRQAAAKRAAQPDRIVRDVANDSREKGAERTIFALPSAERDTVLPILDRYGKLLQIFK